MSDVTTVVHVRIEERRTWRAEVNADELIEAFSEEYAEFMRGDEQTDDDKLEFVKDCIAVMGAADFFTDAPWAKKVFDDTDQEVDVFP